MKAYGGVEVETHIFFISALAGGEWSASPPEKEPPGTHWITGLDDVKKRKLLTLPGLEL
jgi:hypothetical protein